MREHEVFIFEIERFAIHDGPGIRTTIFLQGCPLHCEWCANPESQSVGRHIMTFSKKCIGCGRCVESCPMKAIDLQDGKAVIDRMGCDSCGKCEEACVNHAIRVSGKIMNCEELYHIIARDKEYYEGSGGGITLSGGEALLQIEQIMPLLIECKKHGIHIAIETCGCVPIDKIKAAYPVADLFLFDIKSLDAVKLREYTGGDMKTILAGFRTIAGMNPGKLIIRVPVIPGFNNSEKDITQIFEFAVQYHIREVDLLPYHTFGIGKYEQLGRIYKFACRTSLKKEELKDLKETGKRSGLIVNISG